jgi:hypothetical protein
MKDLAKCTLEFSSYHNLKHFVMAHLYKVDEYGVFLFQMKLVRRVSNF